MNENEGKLVDELKEYFNTTSEEELEKDWNEISYLNNIGPTVEEYIKSVNIINNYINNYGN